PGISALFPPRPRLDHLEVPDRTSAPNPCGESMQAAYSRTAAERIVGNSESPQVELIGGFFSGIAGGAGGGPCIRIPRHKPCLGRIFRIACYSIRMFAAPTAASRQVAFVS